MLDQILTRDNIEKTGYLNSDFILFAYKDYKKGVLFYARQIWNVLLFLIWHELYIETDKFLSMDTDSLTLKDALAIGDRCHT